MCGLSSTTWPTTLFLSLTFLNFVAFGQNLSSMTGKVLTPENRPLPGATIKEKATKDGYYIIVNMRNLKTGINELWPLPQSEKDVHPDQTQNTGY